MSNRLFVKNAHRTKSNRRGNAYKNPRSGSKAAKLRSQKSSLNAAKMAAVRTIANATSAGFLGIEKKFLDMAKTETVISAAAALTGGEMDPSATSGPGGGSGGCIGCLSCPAQGDSEQGRDGKRFVIDSLILKGYVRFYPTATTGVLDPVKVFVAVVLDTQTNGAQMDSEFCFKNFLGSEETNINPVKNLLSGNRFRILKSAVYDLTPHGAFAASATFAANSVRRDFDWYLPFKGGLRVSLKDGDLNSGQNADVANVVDNSLHVIAFSTEANKAYISYNARIRFQG